MRRHRYTDGKDRVTIRTEFRLTRDELIGVLWRRACLHMYGADSPDLAAADLDKVIRQDLWHEGLEGVRSVPADPQHADPGAWAWATRQVERIWPAEVSG